MSLGRLSARRRAAVGRSSVTVLGTLEDGTEVLAGADVKAVDVGAGTVTLTAPLTYAGGGQPLKSVLPSYSYVAIARAGEWGRLFHAGDGDTVLAPSITAATSPDNAAPGSTIVETVTFDAAMDTSVAAASLLQAKGTCKPELLAGSATWKTPHSLEFSFKANAEGTATFTLAPAAKSGGNGTALDGNLEPAGKNAAGPNGDAYTWEVPCTKQLSATAISITRIVCNPGSAATCASQVTRPITTGTVLRVRMNRSSDPKTSADDCGLVGATVAVEGVGTETLSPVAHGEVGPEVAFTGVTAGVHQVTVTSILDAGGCSPTATIRLGGAVAITTNTAP
jgi:hypothetical protein